MGNIQNYSKNKAKLSGFTLIEVLLVIGIFAIVVFAGLPLIGGVVYQNDLETTSLVVVSTLRQAESNARSGIEDSKWGVKIIYPKLTLFKGDTYATRIISSDLDYTLSSKLTFSGLSEITYSKMNAIPSTTGNITITNLNNSTVTININAKGTLTY